MSVSLGMNGFGRIGRYLLRLLADSEDIRITAINARADNASLAHLFKYDSVYGIFPGTVDHDDNGIIINGRHIEVTRCKTGEWEWARLGIDIAVETTGTLKNAKMPPSTCSAAPKGRGLGPLQGSRRHHRHGRQ